MRLLFNDFQQYFDANGDPLNGGKLFTYLAGSSTKQTVYQTDGGSAHTNPIVLGADGRIPAAIWGDEGVSYKLVLTTSGDTDPPASPIWTIDEVTPINDVSLTQSEWVAYGAAATYVSASQFTLAGDQTSTFHVGRRVKVVDSGGTKYGTITVSAYTSLTTVTVSLDSGSLANPITSVSYGVLSETNQAVPRGSIARLDTADQALTGGVVVTSNSLGTIASGTVTPDPGDRPLQHYTNNGAHTLAPSSNAGTVVVDITNGASAGAVTTSGFTLVTGAFTTTNGHKFRCFISIGNAGSLLQIQALQ